MRRPAITAPAARPPSTPGTSAARPCAPSTAPACRSCRRPRSGFADHRAAESARRAHHRQRRISSGISRSTSRSAPADGSIVRAVAGRGAAARAASEAGGRGVRRLRRRRDGHGRRRHPSGLPQGPEGARRHGRVRRRRLRSRSPERRVARPHAGRRFRRAGRRQRRRRLGRQGGGTGRRAAGRPGAEAPHGDHRRPAERRRIRAAGRPSTRSAMAATASPRPAA